VEWQRLATRELASARTDAALDRYETAGLVQQHATREAARAGVISAWQAARAQHPEQSQLILAHERVDVRALNMAARAVRRAAGELGDDQLLQTEAGAQVFAEGDRIYFLRNERGLGGPGGTGVKNGTLGTVMQIEGERLTVRLDGPDGAATGKKVTFDLSDYADIGHGYAATIHKNQGATVDQTHVLATPGMDRHLVYVAMSRHRHAARLHWSEEDFGSGARLRDRLGRERAKDTTLDYRESDAELCAAYAERRGLHPVVPASEIVLDGTPPPPLDLAALAARIAAQPGLVRRNLERLQLAELRSGVAALLQASAAWQATTQAIAAWVKRRAEEQAPVVIAPPSARPTPANPAPAAPPTAGEWVGPFDHMFETVIAKADYERPPAEPMAPAVPYRPVTPQEAAAVLDAALAGKPIESRVPEVLQRAYRDVEQAGVTLETLVRQHGDEGAAYLLRRRGSGLLGKLRGSDGLLASGRARSERLVAEIAADGLPDALLEPARERASRLEKIRVNLEAERQRATIAVPGLSQAALAAIASLQQAGAERPDQFAPNIRGEFSAEAVACAARVAAVYNGIAGNPDSRVWEELGQFCGAAQHRLAGWVDYHDKGLLKVSALVDVLAASQQLVARHEASEAARAEERRRAEQAEREVQEKAARKAEMALRYEAFQRRRPRGPSSGPSMG
jgi:hypothetical protein